jgi:pilus assembly protein CpaB
VRSERVATANGTGAPPGLFEDRKPRRPRRLSTGSIVPIALAVLAAGFGYEALQDRSAMTDIVVASAMVPAGAPVDGSDTRLVSVHAADAGLTRGLLSPTQVAQGWVAAVPVPAGEPITASEVTKPAAGPLAGSMSIAVPVQQAVGGTIAPGDRVDVIAATGQGGSYYVAQDLRVIEVAPTSPASGVLGGGPSSYFIVVSVGKEAALRVAAALGSQGGVGSNSQIEIVRSTGEPPSADVSYSGPNLSTARGVP